MRKILHLAAEEIESNGISNKSEDSVYDEAIRCYEQLFFKTLNFFLKTIRIE